ncbi:hypothetical protein GGI22_001580 [Coemansia erecta]|nr:hypothetical protein GGI22_001580 [Coemansia erecta]
MKKLDPPLLSQYSLPATLYRTQIATVAGSDAASREGGSNMENTKRSTPGRLLWLSSSVRM